MVVLSQLQNFLFDLFFPLQCVVCKKEGAWLCATCTESVFEDYTTEVLPLADGLAIVSLFDFAHPAIREQLHYLKYDGIRSIAQELTALAATKLSRHWLQVMFQNERLILVPVPTSREKLRQRGYNQAEELAKALGAWIDVSVDNSVLIRNRNQKTQVGKGAGGRRVNARQAFSLVSGKLPENAETYTWIIVDDVCTTGSTLSACTSLFSERGLPVGAVVAAHKQGALLL